MPVLICDKCNIYYEIVNIEDINDTCECGNPMKYYDSIEEYMNEESIGSNEDNVEKYDEDTKGIFYSVNKKKLVTLQMEMLKEQEENEKRDRSLRDLKYRIRHAINRKEKKEIENYEPLISKEFNDKNSLKMRKKILLKEIELLKEDK